MLNLSMTDLGLISGAAGVHDGRQVVGLGGSGGETASAPLGLQCPQSWIRGDPTPLLPMPQLQCSCNGLFVQEVYYIHMFSGQVQVHTVFASSPIVWVFDAHYRRVSTEVYA